MEEDCGERALLETENEGKQCAAAPDILIRANSILKLFVYSVQSSCNRSSRGVTESLTLKPPNTMIELRCYMKKLIFRKTLMRMLAKRLCNGIVIDT